MLVLVLSFNCLYSGYLLKTGFSAQSEDPDEMANKKTFHQGLHCLQLDIFTLQGHRSRCGVVDKPLAL